MQQKTTIAISKTTRERLPLFGRYGTTPEQIIKRLMDNALSEETITRLSSFAIINETLDSTVNRLLDRMEVRTKA